MDDGWHSRGYLPHFDAGEVAQMVTFRLAGSLPIEVLARLRSEIAHLPAERRAAEERERLETYLDLGHGPCWLADSTVAAEVDASLRWADGQRYRLHAWVVMPNHVHALFTPLEGVLVGDVVESWKKYSARRANERLGRSGTFWQREYFDRFIRSNQHFEYAVDYIELNPVKAGLCAEAAAWLWSSAAQR